MINVYIIGNKPKENYIGTNYSDLIDNDKNNIVCRINRMMSIDFGLTGSKTDMLFCDKFAFNWDKEFINHVLKVNPNMILIIPFHSIQEFADKFKYDFNEDKCYLKNNKTGNYYNIKIIVVGKNDEDYYVNSIADSMPAIKLTFPNYYPTNVSYCLQYILNKFSDQSKYKIHLMGIDAHDRVHTYVNVPAMRPIVHKAFVPYEEKWMNQLEKDKIITILD